MEENRPMQPDENERTNRAEEQESETAEGGNADSFFDLEDFDD